jgi:cation transport regulator ChaC
MDDFLKVELATNYTIEDYQRDETLRDKEAIAYFIYRRFADRYITPLRPEDKSSKHGFCTMAICCLMIETLESFRQGWKDTNKKGRGQRAFCLFFNREPAFELFRDYAVDFYRGVRCGILHQAETTNGWLIHRHGKLFVPQAKTINATKFHDALGNALKQYCEELRLSDWDSLLWEKFREKMNSVIRNCNEKSFYFAYGSNMDAPHLQSRVPSARTCCKGYVEGKQVLFNKKSKDGSGKANLVDAPQQQTWGVVFEIETQEWNLLDKIEGGYIRQPIKVQLNTDCWVWTETYISTQLTTEPVAFQSYKDRVIKGAEERHLPQEYVAYLCQLSAKPDPDESVA